MVKDDDDDGEMLDSDFDDLDEDRLTKSLRSTTSIPRYEREALISDNKTKLVLVGCAVIAFQFPLLRKRSSKADASVYQLMLEIIATCILENCLLACVWMYYKPAGKGRLSKFLNYVVPALVCTSIVLRFLAWVSSPKEFYQPGRKPHETLPDDHPTVLTAILYYSVVLPWRFVGLGLWCTPSEEWAQTQNPPWKNETPLYLTPIIIAGLSMPFCVIYYAAVNGLDTDKVIGMDKDTAWLLLFVVVLFIMFDVAIRLCCHGRDVDWLYSHGHALALAYAIAAFPSAAGTMMMGAFVSFKGDPVVQTFLIFFWDGFMLLLEKLWLILAEWSICGRPEGDLAYQTKNTQNAVMVTMVVQITDDLWQKLVFLSLDPAETFFWVLFFIMLVRDWIKRTGTALWLKDNFASYTKKCCGYVCCRPEIERSNTYDRDHELKKARKWIHFKCSTSQKMFSDLACITFVILALLCDLFWDQLDFGDTLLAKSKRNPNGIDSKSRYYVIGAYGLMFLLKWALDRWATGYLEERTTHLYGRMTQFELQDTLKRQETGQEPRSTLSNAINHMNDEVLLWDESFYFHALSITYIISMAFQELEFVWAAAIEETTTTLAPISTVAG